MKIYKSADYIKKGNVAVFESQKSVDEEHTHDYLEIVYCQKGAARQYVNREKYEMKRGDMLFITAGLCTVISRRLIIFNILIFALFPRNRTATRR